jgi:hypothetical protein
MLRMVYNVVVHGYIVVHYCLRFARGLVQVVAVSYIVVHYCLRFAQGLVQVVAVSYIVKHYCLIFPEERGLSENFFFRVYIKIAKNVRKSFNVSTSNTIFTSRFEIKIYIFITRF